MKRLFVILLIFLFIFTVFPEIRAAGSNSTYSFSVDPAIHNKYGLTYPVTYEFSLPSGSSNLIAFRRFTLAESWIRITEKNSNDFFNGIEAVRFDYANNIAHVSEAFASYSNNIYVYLADSSGNPIYTNYLGTARYYDNRRVTVIFSIDDVGDYPPWGVDDYTAISTAFANAKVWWTAAVETDTIHWTTGWQGLQGCVNRGYCEVSSHSRTHPMYVPYSPNTPGDPDTLGYDSEIGGSRDDILSNMTLPYSKGSQGYVWSWIEPNGQVDDTLQQKLSQYDYLVSRTVDVTYSTVDYPSWNSTSGIYDLANTSVYVDDSPLTQLNSVFDSVYSSGGIYHVWGHVGQDDWTPGGKAYAHVQHIAGKKDVWYAGFGALYVYAYTRDHIQPQVVSTLNLAPGWNMVSFPVLPADTSFVSIFSGVSFYQVLTWSGSAYTTPTNAQAGQGYWVLVLSSTSISVTGQPVNTYSSSLPAGWSMIGSVDARTVDCGTVFSGYYQALTWSGTSYTSATTIEPGKGYWALVLTPTHVTVG